MSSKFSIKKGATFLFNGLYKDADGQPIDLTNYVIRSQIRDISGQLITDVLVSKADQTADTGVFTLQTDSEAFPLGNLFFDLRIESNGIVIYTSTVTMAVINRVTNE